MIFSLRDMLLGLLFCASSLSHAADPTGTSASRELVRCRSGVNSSGQVNGYVVSIIERNGKTFMAAEKCFLWHSRCQVTEVDFGTFEVTQIYGSYFGNSGSLRFDTSDNSVVFENYEPSVTVTFREDQCAKE
jgi:hypothetical protein